MNENSLVTNEAKSDLLIIPNRMRKAILATQLLPLLFAGGSSVIPPLTLNQLHYNGSTIAIDNHFTPSSIFHLVGSSTTTGGFEDKSIHPILQYLLNEGNKGAPRLNNWFFRNVVNNVGSFRIPYDHGPFIRGAVEERINFFEGDENIELDLESIFNTIEEVSFSPSENGGIQMEYELTGKNVNTILERVRNEKPNLQVVVIGVQLGKYNIIYEPSFETANTDTPELVTFNREPYSGEQKLENIGEMIWLAEQHPDLIFINSLGNNSNLEGVQFPPNLFIVGATHRQIPRTNEWLEGFGIQPINLEDTNITSLGGNVYVPYNFGADDYLDLDYSSSEAARIVAGHIAIFRKYKSHEESIRLLRNFLTTPSELDIVAIREGNNITDPIFLDFREISKHTRQLVNSSASHLAEQ